MCLSIFILLNSTKVVFKRIFIFLLNEGNCYLFRSFMKHRLPRKEQFLGYEPTEEFLASEVGSFSQHQPRLIVFLK